MDTGDSPNAGNPRRRNRGGTFGAASSRPAVDDGADANPAAGHPPRELRPLSSYGSTKSRCATAAGTNPAVSRDHMSSAAVSSGHLQRARRHPPPLHLPPSMWSILARTEECPSEVKSSELGSAVADLPTLEALSLMNELPLFIAEELFIPDETSEDSDGDDVLPRNGGYGQTFLYFNRPKGLTRSMVLAADSLFVTVSNDEEEQPKPDSDVDSDEFEREMEEYYAANPCVPLTQAFNRISAIEHTTLIPQAAELNTEPPSAVIARAALEAQRRQETQSLQAPLQASAGVIQRDEASTEDIVQKGRRWMCEEVMVCFKKYIERSVDLEVLEYKLDELCHQCFNVESYNKVFHHYNFRVMMRKSSSANWTVGLHFAEVKQIFGRKYYFCCPLEEDEDGDCYACKNRGAEVLKHPATGGYDMGSPDAQCSLLW
ncbi:hypothetical protein QOZ80_9AG0691260 [Eleusine coracana subsp. coracana]|nr:hypothetical protein QOZ80_9AG0691260 [Eleusine coracana subsp. coracana]